MRRAAFGLFILSLGALSSSACSPLNNNNADASGDLPRVMGRINPISLSPAIAFEGTRRFVGALGPALGTDDLSAAQPTASAGSGVVIERWECTRVRCVFVAHIDDTIPNRGATISEPSAAVPVEIKLSGAIYDYSAQLGVLPTDTADGATMGATGLSSQAIYSSMTVANGVTLRADNVEQPVRFVVLGPVEFHGHFDFSANATRPGPGGSRGGEAPMSDGQGPAPGIGSMVAGGGGGNATAGTAGMGPGGSVGGAGGGAQARRSLIGGSGGGAGAGGAGGHGGGVLQFFGFSTMNLEGARFSAVGTSGGGAGGGGAGGAIAIGGVTQGAYTIDVRGGAGGMSAGATGGQGGDGRARVDGDGPAPTVQGGALAVGPRFDLSMVPAIVRSPSFIVRGFAPAATRVRIEGKRLDVVVFMHVVVVDASGRFERAVTLPEGVTQIMLYDVTDTADVPVASMSGTRVVVGGEGGARTILGGAIDVAYLPMSD
jgi:hypothetical protein